MQADNVPRKQKVHKQLDVFDHPNPAKAIAEHHQNQLDVFDHPNPAKAIQKYRQLTGPTQAPATKNTKKVVKSLTRSANIRDSQVKDTKSSSELAPTRDIIGESGLRATSQAFAKAPSAVNKSQRRLANELSGQGPIAKGFAKGSAQLGNQLSGAIQSASIGNLLGKPGKTLTKIETNAVKDIVNLPAGTIPSAYLTGQAGLNAAKGNTSDIKKLWKTAKTTDPILLAAQGKFKEAGKQATEHPGFTAVELYGLKGVGGRLAGGVARNAPSQALRDLGSQTNRPNLIDPKSKFQSEQTYSPDLSTKLIQKKLDKTRSSKRVEKKLQKAMNERVDQLHDVGRGINDPSFAKNQLLKEMGQKNDKGKLVLPDPVKKRLAEHKQIDSPDYGLKAMNKGTSLFSRSVLPFSPSWYAGNASEGLLRAGLQKAGPLANRKLTKTIQELEKTSPAAAQELKHFSGHGQGKMLQELDAKVTKPIKKTTDALFQANQKFIETPLLKAIMGKSMKKLGYTAEDMKNPAKRAKVIAEGQRHYGKYSGFGPEMRKGKSSYSPFIAWPINATKFLSRLPEDHPLFSVTTTANNRAQDKNLKKAGLRFGEKGQVPMWMLGSVPSKKGKIPASRYTPFGAGIDPVGTGKGFVPLLKPLIDAANGQDWKGKKLKSFSKGGTAGPAEETAYALKTYAQSLIPGLTLGSNLATKGPQALNPFKPIKNKAKKKKGNIFDSSSSNKKNLFD